MNLWRYLAKRLLLMVPTLLGILLVLVSAFGAIRTRLAEGSKSAVNGEIGRAHV